MSKVISDILKGRILGFRGTVIGSIVTIKETLGSHSGVIISEASFREFTASKGENIGKLYGVVECSVALDSGNTVKCQIMDSNANFEIGDVVAVEITESGKYQNATITGLDHKAKVETVTVETVATETEKPQTAKVK